MGQIRHRRLAFLLLAFMLCLAGCKGVRDIRVNSVEVQSVNIRGLKGLDIHFAAEVCNPAKQVRLSEIEGQVIQSGKVIGKLAMDPVILVAKSTEKYNFKATVSLAEGAGLKELMEFKPEKCTVDLSARAALGKGAPVPVKMKDIPLKELLNTIGNEKN
jgi:hypothetical protein